MTEHPQVVVLAGGEGKRLVSLTRALYGTDLPKQFAALDGDRSLLQQTVERALALTTADRISVIVTGEREAIARAQLAAYPGIHLVVQPRGLDTGPGLLLPLVRILARAPGARVVFLPSDHYLASSAPLLEALRAAAHGELADRISLIGVTPTGPEVEYGWIVGGARIGRTGAVAVARFEEKPEPHRAEELAPRSSGSAAACGTRSSRRGQPARSGRSRVATCHNTRPRSSATRPGSATATSVLPWSVRTTR